MKQPRILDLGIFLNNVTPGVPYLVPAKSWDSWEFYLLAADAALGQVLGSILLKRT